MIKSGYTSHRPRKNAEPGQAGRSPKLFGDRDQNVVTAPQSSSSTKISLGNQIREIEAVLARRIAMTRLKRRNPRMRSKLEFHDDCLRSAVRTLQWLEKHQDTVKRAISLGIEAAEAVRDEAAAKAAQDHPPTETT